MVDYNVHVSSERPINEQALRIHRELRPLLPEQYRTYASGFLGGFDYIGSIFMDKPGDQSYLRVEWTSGRRDITVRSTGLTLEQIKAVLDMRPTHPN